MTSHAKDPSGGRSFVIDDKSQLSSDTLIDRFLATFRAPDYQPPTLPTTALELLALSRRSDVEFAQVLSLLERDPVVASQVLRKAQSAYYAGRTPVKSLHEAIVRLGLSTLRDMFLEVVFKNDVFRAQGYDEPMRALQRHSTAVAYVARKVCDRTGNAAHGQYAFLCGLLHDIGMAMCMIILADKKRLSQKVGREAEPPPFEKIWPAVVKAHEPAGGILGHLWRLPYDINVVLSSHHRVSAKGREGVLAAAVCVADGIASEMGFAVTGEVKERPRDAWLTLGLTEVLVDDIKLQVRGILARIE